MQSRKLVKFFNSGKVGRQNEFTVQHRMFTDKNALIILKDFDTKKPKLIRLINNQIKHTFELVKKSEDEFEITLVSNIKECSVTQKDLSTSVFDAVINAIVESFNYRIYENHLKGINLVGQLQKDDYYEAIRLEKLSTESLIEKIHQSFEKYT